MKKRRGAQHDDSELLQVEAKRSCTQKQHTVANHNNNNYNNPNNNNFDQTLGALVSNFDAQCSINCSGQPKPTLKRTLSNDKPAAFKQQNQVPTQQNGNMFGLLSNLRRIAAETIQYVVIRLTWPNFNTTNFTLKIFFLLFCSYVFYLCCPLPLIGINSKSLSLPLLRLALPYTNNYQVLQRCLRKH